MNDVRADVRIVALAKCLARRPRTPVWVMPYDLTAAVLTVRRYRVRKAAEPTVSRRENDSDYQRYLKSRDWYDFSLAIMALAGGACGQCGEPADDVHHLHYRTIGNESPCDVIPLCRSCHIEQHPGWEKIRISRDVWQIINRGRA